jgi:hypothetical protein
MDDYGIVSVGLGDAAAGVPQLDWAADAARSAHGTLRVVGAMERAHLWLAEMLIGWREKHPDVWVPHTVSLEHLVEALVAMSTAQELLVVGGRSRHARVAPLLGSVSQRVPHHASCPVAVVHTT